MAYTMMFCFFLNCALFLSVGCSLRQPAERVDSSDPPPAIESEHSTKDVLNSGGTKKTAGQCDISLGQRDSGAPLRVEARGCGRAWRFSYSGPDGILGTGDDSVSGGHLRLPAGVDVVLQLRSDDYIYVFSCPELKLKEIAVPDLEFSIDFRSDRRGEYDLAMDPMCGFRLPPGETMGTLSVVSDSDFRLWLEGRPRLY